MLVTKTGILESNVAKLERKRRTRKNRVEKELHRMNRTLITLTRQMKKFQGTLEETMGNVSRAIATLSSPIKSEKIADDASRQQTQLSLPTRCATTAVKLPKQKMQLPLPEQPNAALSRTESSRPRNEVSLLTLLGYSNSTGSTPVSADDSDRDTLSDVASEEQFVPGDSGDPRPTSGRGWRYEEPSDQAVSYSLYLPRLSNSPYQPREHYGEAFQAEAERISQDLFRPNTRGKPAKPYPTDSETEDEKDEEFKVEASDDE